MSAEGASRAATPARGSVPLERTVREVRAALGADSYTEAFNTGAAMDLDAAARFVVGELARPGAATPVE